MMKRFAFALFICIPISMRGEAPVTYDSELKILTAEIDARISAIDRNVRNFRSALNTKVRSWVDDSEALYNDCNKKMQALFDKYGTYDAVVAGRYDADKKALCGKITF